MMFLRKKGQSTLEYAIIIAVVAAALIAMATYMKRGVQGKQRESADKIGDQFSPKHTTYKYTTQQLTPSVYKEEFGKEAEGVSLYKVETAAETKVTSKEAVADHEKIANLNAEKLFE